MALGTPSLTATVIWDDGYPRVDLTMTCTDMTEGSLYRVTPEGMQAVRGLDGAPAVSDVLYGVDYEIPQGAELGYIGIATDGVDTAVTGTETVGPIDRGGDWIWPVGRPTDGMLINVEEAPSFDYEITQDVAKVHDRGDPVVQSGARHWARGEIQFLTLTDDERRQFQQLVFTGRVLVFSPRPNFGFDELFYMAVGKVTEERVVPLGIEPARRWICEVQRVAVPPASFFVAAGDTWQDVYNEGLTWLQHAASGDDWLEFAGL